MLLDCDSDEEELLLLFALCRRKREKLKSMLRVTPIQRENQTPNSEIKDKHELKRNRSYVHLNAFIDTTEYPPVCTELHSDEDNFFTHFNMSRSSFDQLHELLKPKIIKMNTSFRRAICSQDRLAICLRFFITGDSYSKIHIRYNLSRSSIGGIVKQVSRAIWDVLQPIYMSTPTEETWRASETGYSTLWGFPNCVANIDAKHVRMQGQKRKADPNSIVFISLIDPYHRFIHVDLGLYGGHREGNIFFNSQFYKSYLYKKTLLTEKPLPDTDEPLPQVLIGDERFALKSYLMRPYSKPTIVQDEARRNFNESLEHVRRVVHEVFGQMTQTWRIFQAPMQCNAKTSMELIKAICCLHNFVISNHGVVPTEPQKVKSLFPIHRLNRRPSNSAMVVRDKFANYLLWQK